MMPKTDSSKEGKQSHRKRLLLLLLIMICLPPTLWSGCSTGRNFELLSFFFDGVPDPSLMALSDGGVRADGSLIFLSHAPFEADACRECHPNPAYSNQFLTRDDSHVCMKCHEEVLDQYEVMHGAVVGAACLWCHDPHQSTINALLRERPPQLCVQCHTVELMRKPLPQEHLDPNRNCLDCHFGHGGSELYFLRSNARILETDSDDVDQRDEGGA